MHATTLLSNEELNKLATSHEVVPIEGEGWRFIIRKNATVGFATQRRSTAQNANPETVLVVPEGVYLPCLNAAIREGGHDARPSINDFIEGICDRAVRLGVVL